MHVITFRGSASSRGVMLLFSGLIENEASRPCNGGTVEIKCLLALGNVEEQKILSSARAKNLSPCLGKNMAAAYEAHPGKRVLSLCVTVEYHLSLRNILKVFGNFIDLLFLILALK